MELCMSRKERDALVVIRRVSGRGLSQRQAARLLGKSERQVRRMLRRFEAEGDGGLIHRRRGRPSNRRIEAEVRERAVERLRESYSDFGPTLASEKLAERDGIHLGRETVRKLMIEEGLRKSRKRKVKHRQWRARRECFGELVQMDTSDHDWFEGRGEEKPDLILRIDDATSRICAEFFATDSTETNMKMLMGYLRRLGRPMAIYADKASHFKHNASATVEEQLAGRESETQIGRALRELGIEYIPAHSPQAKGRVERSFNTCQDRLIKELRLRGIGTIAEANEYLRREFIPFWNKRFAHEAACPVDAHRPLKGYDLKAILSLQETRTVRNDYTLQYHRRVYQIERESIRAGLRGSKVRVEDRLDGALRLRWRGEYLRYHRIAARQKGKKAEEAAAPLGLRPRSAAASSKPVRPAPDHPWRRTFLSCRKPDISTLR
jgi:transposase